MTPRRRSTVKWILGVAFAAAASAAALQQFRAEDDGPTEPDIKYKEIVAERGVFRVAVSADGVVRPIDRIELKSKASGKVIGLPIEVGDEVAEGSLIAKLDQVEERTALAQAQADLDIARAELGLAEKNAERRRELFERNAVSALDRDQAELNLAVARGKLVQATTALERARERMEDTVIAAPVHGVILQKYVERGQIIASGVSNVGGGTPIADIADMRTVHIEAGVDEIDIGRIELGQIASVRAEAYPDDVYRGEVVRVAPEAREEQNVTVFDVVIRVENANGHLKSGMNAQAEIVILERDGVIAIPLTALQSSPLGAPPRPRGIATVLVKNGSEYTPREIRVGDSDYRVVEVLEGLEPGDVLGIPMTSRLKADHDILDARIRSNQGFGRNREKDKDSGARRD
jgi:HlyD family secretion protein